MIMRQRSRVGLLLVLFAIVAIAGFSTAAIDHTTDTVKRYTTNAPNLQDADSEGNTAVLCSVNKDWNTWEIHLSTDQGGTWSMADYYNGSASGNYQGDECKVDVGPNGTNAIAVFREADRINVAMRLDGASVWEIDKESLNFTDSITQPYLDVQIKNSTTWIVLGHVGGDWQFYRTDDGGVTYTNKSFASEFGGNHAASMCTVDDGAFEKIYVIGAVGPDARYRAYRTDDGGDTWSQEGVASESSTNFQPSGDTECIATGNYNVYHSLADGYGGNWQIEESQNDAGSFSNVFYTTNWGTVDRQHVLDTNGTSSLIASAEGHMISTTDGSSWTERSWASYSQGTSDVPFLYTPNSTLNGLIAQKSDRIDVLKEKPPKPGVDRSATLFGNAQSVRVSWHETPQVLVRDANGDDQIFRLDAGLAEQKKKKVCDATYTVEDTSWWDWFLIADHTEKFQLREPGGVAEGLAVTRNTTANTVHTCRVYENWNNEEWGATVIRDGSDLSFLGYNTSGTQEAPIGFDGLHADELAFGLIGDNPSAGSGNWGYMVGKEIYTSGDIFPSNGEGNTVLPVVDELNAVAIDKRQDLQTRLFCAISGSNGTGNGTQCWNQAGGEVAHNTSLAGNSLQVYDHNVFIANGSHVARYSVDTTAGTFTEEASTTVGGEDIRVTKDGQYIVDCGSTDLAILNSTDLSTVTTTETISSGGDLRLCDVDWSNSYAYTVDDTTIYRVPLFNHTQSEDETSTIVGSVNTVDSGGDTQATDDEDTNTTTDPTDDVTKSPVTDTTELSDSLGISLESANTFMAVITIGVFGVGGVVTAGLTIGRGEIFAGLITTLVGAGVAIAYGWAQDWLIFLLVLVLALAAAMKLR